MWKHPRWMDKDIRESKGANKVMTCGMRGHPTGPILDLPVGWGKKMEGKKIKSFKEKLYLLSKLPGIFKQS